MSRYTLPELRYDYAALEPHMNARIVELHHDKHHRAYVDGANATIEKLMAARDSGNFEHIGALEKAIAFHVSGHVLHSIYWQNLMPGGGGEPDKNSVLGACIQRDFGGFARFKKQLTSAAQTIMGSGWAALVYDPVLRRLGTVQIHDHQSVITQGSVPLMVIDGWEHAYYLQYQTDKASFFNAIWNLWNWEDIEQRFLRAQALDLGLENAAHEPAMPGGTSAQPAH